VTKEGDTPIELALRFGHAEIADFLKQARQAAETAPEAEPAPQVS
jgi:ankyrin repeat protein